MKNVCSLVLLAATIFFSTGTRASDWPNFRGPNHNGISAETGWLAQWPADGPKQLWKASLGVGYSSITVAQGRACATGNDGTTATLDCFDAETGHNNWKFSYPSDLYEMYNQPKGLGGTSGSATIDGDRVYLTSGNGCVFALNLQNGGVIWSNDLFHDLGAAKPMWGFSSSPVVQNNLLIVDIAGGTALDKFTGKLLWSLDKSVAGYSTPVPFSFNGTPALAIISTDTAYALEIQTGKPLWKFPFRTANQLNIADVVVSGNDFFVSAAYNHGGVMAHLDGTNATQVWASRAFANHVCTSVLIDGCLYGVAGSINGGGPATLRCLDFASGAEKWNFPDVGVAGFIVADHKFIMLSDRGELMDAAVSPNGFTPISRAQVLGASCWSSPTLANGRIYCRNNKGDMVCLEVKGS